MTHYFRNEMGNRVIAVDGDRVTEFTLLFTMGVDMAIGVDTTAIVELEPADNPVDTKSVKTKKKSKADLSDDEKKEAKKAYMKEWYEKKRKEKGEDKPSKRVATGTGNSGVAHEPNLKLIQEYGKSAVDAIIVARIAGMTPEEIDLDQPKGIAHLTYGQIETIYDAVVL